MKVFQELNERQQSVAISRALSHLLNGIADKRITFSPSHPVSASIDAANRESQEQQAPWFFQEILLSKAREPLMNIAVGNAQRAFYQDPGDLVFRID